MFFAKNLTIFIYFNMNFLFKGEIINYDFFLADNENDEHLESKNLKNVLLNFNKNNLKNETVVFLHGWGGNKNSFRSTINLLKHNFNILTITMPTIKPTNLSWTLLDFANLILNILKLHNINSIFVVCHSFGFRVACLLKTKIDIKKIIVTGGAGPKRTSILKKIKMNNNKILLKQKRFNYLYNFAASPDYKSLTPTNKRTFNNVISINTKYFCKFNCPMLLFWGKFDRETKFWIAKLLKKVNNAKLILTKSDHFAYLKYEALFNNAVLDFLNDLCFFI